MPTKGLDQLRARIQAMPEAVREAAKEALDKSADALVAKLHQTVTKGDSGKLDASIARRPGQTDLSVVVSVGGPEAPYAAHVEFGHMDGDTHVPPQPYFFPAVAVQKKKMRSAVSRAITKAYKGMGGNDE